MEMELNVKLIKTWNAIKFGMNFEVKWPVETKTNFHPTPHPSVSGIVNERLVLLDKCDKFEETFHIAHFKIPSEVEYR